MSNEEIRTRWIRYLHESIDLEPLTIGQAEEIYRSLPESSFSSEELERISKAAQAVAELDDGSRLSVTDVRVTVAHDSSEDKLRAFCSITIDGDFVVKDVKIIEGSEGPFVAMPSRKLADRCPACRGKNHLRARFCNECGTKLAPDRAQRDPSGKPMLHIDIAHPINPETRKMIESLVLERYAGELDRREREHGDRAAPGNEPHQPHP
jgi:DNA-binding cell septation regulator SpoVG